VLSLLEAPTHPHHQSRDTFVEVAGVAQPAPAPRFSRTPCAHPAPPGDASDELLATWGIPPERVARLRAGGALA
jgi:alpha-methylacyl-CoA racemase